MIKLDAVTCGYRNAKVLSDISLEISGPGITCILGPNGVGKTTLFHVLLNVHKNYSGNITIDEKNLKDYSIPELSRKLSYVSNSSREVFPLSLEDYIKAPIAIQKRDVDDCEVSQILSLLDLDVYRGAYTDMLSTGQYRLATIIRGLMQNTPYLLLDEPTANLDSKYKSKIMSILKHHSKNKNVRIIIICHDVNICMRYADDVLLLYPDCTYEYGIVDQVITESNLEKLYQVHSNIITVGGLRYALLEV